MKPIVAVLSALVFGFYAIAAIAAIAAIFQVGDAMALQTNKGPVALYPVHHASFVMAWNGQTIYVDPTGSAGAYTNLGAPDLILITHAHADHLSPDTLAAIDTRNATLVMPQSVADEIGNHYGEAQLVMANGGSVEKRGIQIHALPMYNLPESADAFHPKGWGNGYVLTLGDKRIYVSGDTEGIPEMRSLENIDLAFVCMNLPYTMDVTQAADAVTAFEPGVVYPYHYRGQDTRKFKRLVQEQSAEIEIRLRDWYGE